MLFLFFLYTLSISGLRGDQRIGDITVNCGISAALKAPHLPPPPWYLIQRII